jgi:hypothetical protein
VAGDNTLLLFAVLMARNGITVGPVSQYHVSALGLHEVTLIK